ncbi:phage tail protein [Providencia huaxiensis]|uniref:phage tail protein n=1 Tax=Providencia huaxiensis TaxID=2027290 RepID=UPI003D2BA4B9
MTPFYTILTNYGKTALAEALAAQLPLEIPHMAVGDGSGAYYDPVEDQTNLRNELWRGDLNDLRTDANVQGQVIAEAIIPMGIDGDWTVREIGLFDAKGGLIAVGKYPETYIPSALSGAKSQVHISIIINVDNVAAVQLIVDHGQVLASKLYTQQVSDSLRADFGDGDGSLIGLEHGTLKDAINYVTPEMFGNTTGDAYMPLQKALSSPQPCKLAAKTYRTSKPLYYDSGKVIEGAGENLTRIVKYTNSKSGLGIINIDGKPMNYDVDAVLIARASEQYWYNHFTRLSGFTLVREGNVEDITQVFGWYAPLICQNAYSNIHVEGQCTGIFTVDYWMLSWNRVESFCAAPWVMGYEGTPWIANGTSNVFNACWAHSAKGDNYAWDIRNIMYSEMIGGGTDKIGSDGSPCAGMMRFKNSRMTLSNVGGEKIHATRLVRATDGSVIALNQCDFFNVYNKYAPENITWDNVNVLFQAVGNSTIIFDGTGVNAIYDFDSGLPNISSLAHAVDRSKIIWKGNSRSRPLLQEINRSAGDKKTKYGITWASSSKVQIHTEGIFIDDESDGENKNLGTDVKVLDKIHSTFRAFKTSSYIESKSSELNGGHLDALRVRGNISFHSPSAANNSIANGYPEDGGAYFINQHSTGGIGLYTRTIQEAIKTDDTGWVYKWIRGAEWGKPFGKWRKVTIT